MTRQRASASTTFFSKLKFSAKDGSVEFLSSQPNSEWEELELPLNLIIDAGSFRTGWRKLQPGDVDFCYHADAFSGKWPDEPQANFGLDREDKPYSKVMSFLVTGSALQNEITEMAAGSRIMMSALDDMLDAFEGAGGGPGKACKAKLTGSEKVKTKNGSFHAPVFEVVEVIDRDQFFDGLDVCSPDKLWGGETTKPQAAAASSNKTATADTADADFF